MSYLIVFEFSRSAGHDEQLVNQFHKKGPVERESSAHLWKFISPQLLDGLLTMRILLYDQEMKIFCHVSLIFISTWNIGKFGLTKMSWLQIVREYRKALDQITDQIRKKLLVQHNEECTIFHKLEMLSPYVLLRKQELFLGIPVYDMNDQSTRNRVHVKNMMPQANTITCVSWYLKNGKFRYLLDLIKTMCSKCYFWCIYAICWYSHIVLL